VRLVEGVSPQARETEMTPEAGGYFTCESRQAEEGGFYAYRLDDGQAYPDPASRWQPQGVHRPSALFFPQSYSWSDQRWRGVSREDLVIYELHVGTFTPQGTLEAVAARLPQLAALGITAVELMPVAQFPGDRNWGYDGVHPYAVHHGYGGPRVLQRLVDAAHQARLAVILDVVYNHCGPEGNYLAKFGPYFTDRYRTPWGEAMNFDGAESDAVRRFVVDNACAWVRDYHVDGLRLDAVQTIYDFGPRHILAEIQAAVQEEAARQDRRVHVIAETNQNDVRLVSPPERGGYGLDGVWSDDFHHSLHALLTGQRDGYYQDFGSPAHLVKALADAFVYDGGYSPFHRRCHGTPVDGLDRTHFVVCAQNHDQVGNRPGGDRLAVLVPPAAQRLACGLLLLSPCVPLLFMGEEYGERRPFPYFCSLADPALAEAVRRGRREEFAGLSFRWAGEIPDPQSPDTFAAAQLQWSWPAGSPQAQLRQLYQDLLAARREWPGLRDRQHTRARLAGDPPAAVLWLERGGPQGVLTVANLTAEGVPVPAAHPPGRLLLSTEDVRYGGGRHAQDRPERLLPYEILVFSQAG
jgi:maltooligosyltrehalose trehalohydrolase